MGRRFRLVDDHLCPRFLAWRVHVDELVSEFSYVFGENRIMIITFNITYSCWIIIYYFLIRVAIIPDRFLQTFLFLGVLIFKMCLEINTFFILDPWSAFTFSDLGSNNPNMQLDVRFCKTKYTLIGKTGDIS